MKLYSLLKKSFKKTKKKYFYPLNDLSLRNEDLIEGIKVILTKNLTISKKTYEFENYFKKKMNFKHALMLNSGSSANLLALQCLINPYRKTRLKPGDEVLIPALCWSTSLWPIVQSGLKPIFVDVEKNTLNVSIKDLTLKINKRTKAIMLVHVLGNSTNMSELMKIVNKNNLVLIEDTCESLGSKYNNKYLGGFGQFSTFSFYYSHQISSIEGGMICCKNKKDADIVKALRSHGWARGLSNQKEIEKKNRNINKRFLFINSGFNLRPTEIQAAIGHSQFKSLNYFIRRRNLNRKKIINALINDNRWKNQVHFIKENNKVSASWFGMPMLMNKKFAIHKERILFKLDKLGVENRPIISGNFTIQPSSKKYKLVNKRPLLPNTDHIHKLGLFIGLKISKISNKELIRFKEIFFEVFKLY